jgi:hypothetical protein
MFLPPLRLYPLIEAGAVVAFFYYLTRLVLALATAVLDASWYTVLWSSFLTAILGYLASDFVSGLVHFLGDTFGDPETPFFGPHFIFPFREHHVDQTAITRHGFLQVNGNNCLISLIVLIPTYYYVPFSTSLFYWLSGLFVALFVLFIFLTNQIHKWAHSATRPAFVTILQKYNIILSPARHELHHTAPFASYFCITNGWVNPVIEKTGIFHSNSSTLHSCS